MQHIHVMGLQASGTTFVESLLRSNIENVSVQRRRDGGHFIWKHGFVKDTKISKCKNECIFIHIFQISQLLTTAAG